MNSKQEYYKAFQALINVRRQFVDEFQMRLYAYYGFYYYFNDAATVQSGFLASLSPADQ